MSCSDLNVLSRTKQCSQLKGFHFFFFYCATFCCLSKPSFDDLQEAALGTSVQLTGEGIYCQQDKDRKRWAMNWQVIWSLLLVGKYVRVMKRVKFNLWPQSLGHCMINSDPNARGYREGKCQQIHQIQY